jgi:surfeit locus 1 family protein
MGANEIYAFGNKGFMIANMKFNPKIAAFAASLTVFTLLMGLGTWQVKRLGVKTAQLAQIHDRMEKPPVPMPENLDPAAWEFRRVTLTGHFLYDHEFLVKPRTLDGVNGYHMIVPFQRLSGGLVMVNRGWISDAFMPKASRPAGTVQIEGIVQQPRKNYFTPQNNPTKNDWYWADVNAMAVAAQLKPPSPALVTIAVRKPGVYPAGGKVELNIRNDHRQYAIFWFVLAVISQIIFFMRYRQLLPK